MGVRLAWHVVGKPDMQVPCMKCIAKPESLRTRLNILGQGLTSEADTQFVEMGLDPN